VAISSIFWRSSRSGWCGTRLKYELFAALPRKTGEGHRATAPCVRARFEQRARADVQRFKSLERRQQAIATGDDALIFRSTVS
jgi:hypothetical protein